MKHVEIIVKGKVQGVFFRATALGMAERLGLNGYVRNEPDGSVRIEVEGDEKAVEEFIQWAHQGPPAARVESVDVKEGPGKGFTDFHIEYA